MLGDEGVDTKQFDCAECTIPSGMKPPVEPVTPPVEPVTPPVEPEIPPVGPVTP